MDSYKIINSYYLNDNNKSLNFFNLILPYNQFTKRNQIV